jgi:hypothetical protein
MKNAKLRKGLNFSALVVATGIRIARELSEINKERK